MSNSENENNTLEVLTQTRAPAQTRAQPQTDGNAIASLVLGIISLTVLLVSFGAFFLVSLALSIVGFILGAISMKANPSGMAKTGRILNIITLTVSIFLTIFFIFIFVAGFISSFTANMSAVIP